MSFFSQFLLTKIFGFKTKSSWEKIISTQTMLVDDLIKERNKFYKINSKYTDCEYLPGPLSRALNNGTIYFPEQLIVTYLWQYYTLKKWRYKDSTIIEDINWQANSSYAQNLGIAPLVATNDTLYWPGQVPIKELGNSELNNFKDYLIARLNYHFNDEKYMHFLVDGFNYPADENRTLLYEFLYDSADRIVKKAIGFKS